MDINSILDLILSFVRGIYTQALSVASVVYPSHPTWVLIGTGIVTLYLLRDKISSIVMVVIAGILLWLFLKGGV